MKSKKSKLSLHIQLLTAVTTLALPTGIILGAKFTLDYNAEQREAIEDLTSFMKTNQSGTKILTLPLNDNPIAVVLDSFGEEHKKLAVDAINSLDQISENVNYTILDKDDIKIKQKIHISLVDNLSEEKQAGGQATYTYNETTGKINFPIDIYLDPDCIKFTSTETGENMFTTVVKHEMLHTLGFKDIYDESLKNSTVMYYSINDDNRALDYTPSDKINIQTIYDNYVDVTYPKSFTFQPFTKKEELCK